MKIQEWARGLRLPWLEALQRPRFLLPAIAVVLVLSVVALSAPENRPSRFQTGGTGDQGTEQTFGPGASEPVADSGSPIVTPTSVAKSKTRSASGTGVGPAILPADKTPLKIGVIAPSGDSARAFGASTQREDIPHLVRSMTKEINDSGGIAGRPVEVIIKEVDQTDQSSANQSRLQNEACRSLTEDHKVFLVSGASDYTFRCYADHRTPMLQISALADDYDVSQFRPWLLPTAQALFSTIARFAPEAWAQEGALSKKMGFIGYEIPSLRRTAPLLIDEIEKRGGKVIDQRWSAVSYQDAGVVIAQAVLDFKRQNIDRVFYWAPGGAAWLVFARHADAQQYYPRHLLTGHDHPQGTIEIFGPGFPESQLPGTILASHKFVFDVSEKAFPLTAEEKKCFDVLNKRAQTNYQTRAFGNGAAALTICETFYLIRAALAPAAGKPLNPVEIPDLVGKLGSSYKPVMWPQYGFAPGRPDAAQVYGRAFYDQAGCKCFNYRNPAFYPIP